MNKPECIWDARAALGEGPLWSVEQQSLYWVDILNRRLHRYSPRQGRRSWQFDQEISAVAECADRTQLIVALRHHLAFFDPATEALEYLAQPEAEIETNRFNDAKCDRLGRFWAGTMDFDCKQSTGSLYRLGSDLKCARMDSDYVVTNGPAWSSDQKTLYHNDTVNGRVYAFDFDLERGEIANKRLFLAFSREEGFPDGMTTDAEGGLWIAHWGAGKLTRHDTKGKVTRTIHMPCSQVTSCTFGGTGLTTLYVTTAADGLSERQLRDEPLAGGLFAVEMNVPGVPANRFKG
jgi:D-xylonolactonase